MTNDFDPKTIRKSLDALRGKEVSPRQRTRVGTYRSGINPDASPSNRE